MLRLLKIGNSHGSDTDPVSPASLCGKYLFVCEDEQLGDHFEPGDDSDEGELTLTGVGTSSHGELALGNIGGFVLAVSRAPSAGSL